MSNSGSGWGGGAARQHQHQHRSALGTCSFAQDVLPRSMEQGDVAGWKQAGTDSGSQKLELSPVGPQSRAPGSSLGSCCPYVVSGIARPLGSSDLAF